MLVGVLTPVFHLVDLEDTSGAAASFMQVCGGRPGNSNRADY